MKIKDLYLTLCWVCCIWIAWQVLRGSEGAQAVSTSSSSSSSSSSSDGSSQTGAAGSTHPLLGPSGQPFGSSAAASGSGSLAAAGGSSHAAETLVSWLLQHKALVNVDVAYAGPSRGNVVLAQRPMSRGDVLAAVPVELCWAFEQHGAPSNNLELAAVNLLLEMSQPGAFWQPFFATLPQLGELVSPLVQMPLEYAPLLQSEPLERYVEAYQARVTGYWQHVVQPNDPSISLEMYKHARSVLVTRMFATALHGNMLVPLLHLSNHVADCTNFYTERPCPHDPSRACMVWMAGTFIAKGAEVCNCYKYMPNDKAMLQYGFLQDGPISKHLHLVDLPGFNGSNVWALHEASRHGPPLFDGSLQELQQEVARLSATLTQLQAADARAAQSTPPAAAAAAAAAAASSDSSSGSAMLALLRRWRGQRQEVLQLELQRLQQQISMHKIAALPSKTGAGAGAGTGLSAGTRTGVQLGASTRGPGASGDGDGQGAARRAAQAQQSLRECVVQHGGWVHPRLAFGPQAAAATRPHPDPPASQAAQNLPAQQAAQPTPAPPAAQHPPAALQPAVRPGLLVGSASQPPAASLQLAVKPGLLSGSASQPPAAWMPAVKPGLLVGSAVAAGQVLAAVPLQLAVALRPWKLRMDLTKSWRDMHHPRSPRAPYFTTLLGPTAGQDASSVRAAALTYLHSVGHKQLEALLLELHPGAVSAAVGRVRALQELNVTAEQLQHALALVVPRLVTLPEGSFLVPIIDAAEHRLNCPNTLTVTDCTRASDTPTPTPAAVDASSSSNSSSISISSSSSSSSDGVINTTPWCVVLRAGAALAAGESVCIPV